MKRTRRDAIKSYKKYQHHLCLISSTVNQKEFYGSRAFCFKEKTASIEELIVFLLTLNQLPMTRPDTS